MEHVVGLGIEGDLIDTVERRKQRCELVLAVDISQSMDTDEQEVQRAGYVAAITSQEVLDAIKYGPTGRIAITYFEWGGVGEHFTVADWMVIEDEAIIAMDIVSIVEEVGHRVTGVARTRTEAVRLAVSGASGVMPILLRTSDEPYQTALSSAPLAAVANEQKRLPADMIPEPRGGATSTFRRSRTMRSSMTSSMRRSRPGCWGPRQ